MIELYLVHSYKRYNAEAVIRMTDSISVYETR